MKTRRRDEWIVALLVLMVGLETWWILAANPVAIVSEGQGEIVLQGHSRISSEQNPRDPGGGDGKARPPDGPPAVGHPAGAGQSRRGGRAPYGNGEGRPGPSKGGREEDGSANRSGLAAPTRPRETGDRRDEYHMFLAGIIMLDAASEISPDQARLLLRAIRARESLKSDAIPQAVKVIYPMLDRRQRAVLDRVRADRMREGNLPTPPEEVPGLIEQVLKQMEGK